MNKIFIVKEFASRLLFFHTNRRYKSFCDVYNTKEVEQDTSAFDRSNKKLFPDVERKADARKFNSILPPPNVTGNLHLGHAMMITVLDVICRWKHLNGYNVELVPGLDHAGIATQVVVEQQLKKELGLTRFDIGKNAFVEKALKWKDEKGGGIKEDILKIGTIFNWEKEYYTMDQRQSFAVAEAFIGLFDEKLIYRKEALVNWSFALKSTISDIEVENIEINGPTKIPVPGYDKDVLFGEIYNISYKTNDNEFITVATTRPETILGDTAVAVNPNDERYSHLHGKNTQLWHPFRNEWIPLIFDESVSASFGTGAVKITPSHSKADYEIALRHKLPFIPVIDQNGAILNGFNEFTGLLRFIAREKILDSLANMNLFKSKTDHKLDLPICSRSKDVIELLTKPQWFLRCDEMSKEAIRVVKTGELEIEPSKFQHDWNRWFENPIDWCLSRQIWWGHQIPAYHCTYKDSSIWVAAHTQEEALDKAVEEFAKIDETVVKEKITVKQDEDVLDTWFSSGILPFSLFGWPKVEKLTENYPLDVLVSGHDILLFWIARMVMLSTHFQKTVPFRKVFCHGIVCDEQGKKMSKSRGNVVTPDQVINGASLKELKDELKKLHKVGILTQKELSKSIEAKEVSFPKGIPFCGVDALRFTLCFSDVREHFIKFDPNDCKKNHRFLNKIWNATKFTLTNCSTYSINPQSNANIKVNELSLMDKWILSRLARTISETSNSLNALNAGCASLWKEFFYENLCDVYVESAKYSFQNGLTNESQAQCEVLKICLAVGLRYMGVFTPFLSNELLTYLPNQMEFKPHQWIDDALENEVSQVLEVCSEIRKIKKVQNILKKHGPRTYLFSTDEKTLKILHRFQRPINSLTFSLNTNILPIKLDAFNERDNLILSSIVNECCSVAISTDVKVQLIDIQERNKKKLAKLQNSLKIMIDKTTTDKYIKKTKPHIKERDLLQIRDIETQIKTLSELIEKEL